MWKIESITFAEKNQSIVEYPIVYEPKKNVLDEQLEFDTQDIKRIEQVEEEFKNHELKIKALIKQKE